MSSQYGNVSEGARGFRNFNNNKYVQGTKDFLNSNSLIAMLAFIILVLILFVFALRVGTNILDYLFSPNPNPFLIKGMVDAKQLIKISQDPGVSGSVPIMRSKNEMDGMEFTWSVWIYIDDFNYKRDEYKHIFHKGNDDINVTNPPIGMNYPNNAPGLYITPYTNDLLVVMNTFDVINEEVLVKDVPLNKWVNVILRLDKNHQLDVYINGTLTKRHLLAGVPKQNYGDVYVSLNGGFSGYTSCLRYFSSALGTNQINNIVDKGACLQMEEQDLKQMPHYLSTRWYFSGANDMYNPNSGPEFSS